MARSRFRTEKTRDEGNDGGETRLQMRTSSGVYRTIAHFTDAAIARTIARLLNQRTTENAAAKDARAAAQRELLPVEHDGLHPRRLKAFKDPDRFYHPPPNAEAFYANAWKKWNSGNGGGGSGTNVLHYILCSEADHAKGWTAVDYSRRDAQVAATVIQWLGTNVGRGFVQEVEAKIKQYTDRQHEIGDERRRDRFNADTRTPLQRRKATLKAARERLTPKKGKP